MNLIIENIELLLPVLAAILIACHQHSSKNELSAITCIEKIYNTLEGKLERTTQQNLVKSYFQATTGSRIDISLINPIIYSENPINVLKKCKTNSKNLNRVNSIVMKEGINHKLKGQNILWKNYLIFIALYIIAFMVRTDWASSFLLESMEPMLPYITKDEIQLLFLLIILAASPFLALNMKKGYFYFEIEKVINESAKYNHYSDQKKLNKKLSSSRGDVKTSKRSIITIALLILFSKYPS